MRFGLFAVITLTFILPTVALAQSLGALGDSASFSLSASPQYPSPNSTIALTFNSTALDLANVTVSVSVNGKNIYKGTVQSVAVTLGKAGSITNVAATISTGGVSYSRTLTIQPEDVTLVAEPISSAPVLYQGKPLVPLEGDVRVVAMANLKNSAGTTIDPSTLSYDWTVDGTEIISSSGIGKSTIMVAAPLQYRSRDVTVVIMSQDGSLVGGDSLSLTALDPLVRIYENDPLLGIRFDHALSGEYTIPGTESTLFAAPFSLPTTNGAPLLQWFLNGAAAQTGNSITLRPTGTGEGTATLSLTASSGTDTTASENLSLIFGATSGSNFFGL